MALVNAGVPDADGRDRGVSRGACACKRNPCEAVYRGATRRSRLYSSRRRSARARGRRDTRNKKVRDRSIDCVHRPFTGVAIPGKRCSRDYARCIRWSAHQTRSEADWSITRPLN